MKWRCFFGHDWKCVGKRGESTYGSDRDIPINMETIFLFKCQRCEFLKIQIIPGLWNDDDDDGDEKPPTPPVMCPDDYFESIGK